MEYNIKYWKNRYMRARYQVRKLEREIEEFKSLNSTKKNCPDCNGKLIYDKVIGKFKCNDWRCGYVRSP